MRTKMFFVTLSTFVWVMTAGAAHAETANPADAPALDPQATAVMNRMAEFLAGAKSFSVTADIGFDAVQASGQKIEFGETRKVVLRRPGHLRVDETKRNGATSQLIYDGQNLSLYYPQDNVYAIEPKAGTVDEMIRYLTDDLDVRLPLAEMLSTQLPAVLKEKALEVSWVEESTVAGVLCDHLVLRGEEVDVQLWVAKGDKPFPYRIIITYIQSEGAPQFWAQLSDWDLAPQAEDAFFEFNPGPEAKKVAFSPRSISRKENAEEVSS